MKHNLNLKDENMLREMDRAFADPHDTELEDAKNVARIFSGCCDTLYDENQALIAQRNTWRDACWTARGLLMCSVAVHVLVFVGWLVFA